MCSPQPLRGYHWRAERFARVTSMRCCRPSDHLSRPALFLPVDEVARLGRRPEIYSGRNLRWRTWRCRAARTDLQFGREASSARSHTTIECASQQSRFGRTFHRSASILNRTSRWTTIWCRWFRTHQNSAVTRRIFCAVDYCSSSRRRPTRQSTRSISAFWIFTIST